MTEHVVVVSTGRGCLVVPGHRIMVAGDDIHIKNSTGDKIDLAFADPALWAVSPPTPVLNGATSIGTVANAVPGGFYPYSVYCHKNGDYAEGNSHPAFIVR